MPALEARAIEIVFCDIDDTLTINGRLPAVAYAAMERLDEAGIAVVPVTGRPAGWCDMICRFWPVRGVIGENGAFYFVYEREDRRIKRSYWRTEIERTEDRTALEAIRSEVLRTVPGCAIASDQAYREADLAVDFAEDVGPLPDKDVQKIVEIFEKHGAIAKISSIHVNGWFGDYDKKSMCAHFLKQQFHLEMEQACKIAAFIGDSPNDEPMFGSFPCSIGVRNLEGFIGMLRTRPTYLTADYGGFGFAELAELLIRART